MRPHILYVGGEDHHARIPFLLAIQSSGFRVTAAGSGPAAPFRDANIEFHPFAFSRFLTPLADLRSLKALAKILTDLQPDIAQGYDAKPCLMLPLAAGLARSKTKTIRTLCGRGWVFSPGSLLAVSIRPAYWGLHRLASLATAGTVFEIEQDRSFFQRWGMGGRNSVVIPAGGGGIDEDGFSRSLSASPSRMEIRQELGLGSAPVVISVGRLTRQKGIPTLLAAAAIIHDRRPEVRFLIVGPRESEGRLAISQAELDAHKPYVIATGPRSDIPALLRAADVFAFPTEYAEGVPRVLLEATLAGLPIVSSNMPGCLSLVRDGWSGRIVDRGSSTELAEAILDLLGDPTTHSEMVWRAADLTRKTFCLKSIVAHHSRFYASILDDSRGALERRHDVEPA